MEKVLDAAQTTGPEFHPSGGFMLSAHGVFTGDIFVYCIPNQSIIAEDERVTADWVKMDPKALTPDDPVASFDCAPGYICQVRAVNAGATVVYGEIVVRQSRYGS